jgi:hypothetical protein
MTYGERLAPGTLTVSALTSAYDIEAFPRAADQPVAIAWSGSLIAPYDPAGELVDALDFSRGAQGNGVTALVFPYCTPGMVQYLNDTFFPDGAWSALVTVRVLDPTVLDAGENWRVINATALRNLPSKAGELYFEGLRDYRIDLVDAKDAAP